jgi:hypothetical protein
MDQVSRRTDGGAVPWAIEPDDFPKSIDRDRGTN